MKPLGSLRAECSVSRLGPSRRDSTRAHRAPLVTRSGLRRKRAPWRPSATLAHHAISSRGWHVECGASGGVGEKEEKKSPITILAAMTANLVIAVAKFIAAGISGSSAMASEGIHSVIDTGNQVLLLIGVKRSERPADLKHPFGYGLERYFWSLIVAILLFGIGGGMSIYEGYHHLQNPGERGDVMWSYAVLAVAFVAEGTSWVIAARAILREGTAGSFWKKLHASKAPSRFVVVGEDTAALAGILTAFVGIAVGQWLDSPVPDAIASMIIGLILCGTAVYLSIQSKKLLIGESADPEMVRAIHELVAAHPAVERVGYPLTMHFGPEDVLVNLDIRFDPRLGSIDLARAIDDIERRIHTRYPMVTRVFVEAQLEAGEGIARHAFETDERGGSPGAPIEAR